MLRSLLRLQRPSVQPLSIHIEALIKDLLEVEALCEENDKFDLPFISYPETECCSGQFSIQGTSFNNVGATCKYQSIVKVNNIKVTTSKVRVYKPWSINEYKKALRIAIEDVQEEVLPWLIYPPMMFINLIDWRPGNPKRIQRLSSKDKAASCSPNVPHSSNNNGSNPNGICSIHVFNPMPILKIIISDNPSACNLFNCFSNQRDFGTRIEKLINTFSMATTDHTIRWGNQIHSVKKSQSFYSPMKKEPRKELCHWGSIKSPNIFPTLPRSRLCVGSIQSIVYLKDNIANMSVEDQTQWLWLWRSRRPKLVNLGVIWGLRNCWREVRLHLSLWINSFNCKFPLRRSMLTKVDLALIGISKIQRSSRTKVQFRFTKLSFQ